MNITIGDIGYLTLRDAVDNANNGDVIVLHGDITLGLHGEPDNLLIEKDITLDIGTHNIYGNGDDGVLKIRGGTTIINGTGTIYGSFGERDLYSMAIWCADGKAIINGGTYRNSYGPNARGLYLIWATGNGIVEINDGIFEGVQPEFTLNCRLEDYESGTSNIIVKGGKFYNFDPSQDVIFHNYETKDNVFREGIRPGYVPDGYKLQKKDNYYIVRKH